MVFQSVLFWRLVYSNLRCCIKRPTRCTFTHVFILKFFTLHVSNVYNIHHQEFLYVTVYAAVVHMLTVPSCSALSVGTGLSFYAINYEARSVQYQINLRCVKYKAGWVLEPTWTFWRTEKSHVPAGIQTQDHPAHTLVSIPTMSSQLQSGCIFFGHFPFNGWKIVETGSASVSKWRENVTSSPTLFKDIK